MTEPPFQATSSPPPAGFTYFAFISYSRKDAKAAAWLQRRLEWFRFPIQLVDRDKAPPHSRYLRPIYRDKTHLENDSAHYWQNIRSAIENSRFLVVLCSPHSAASKPVDDEVTHFLATRGDLQSLVPVILSGRVASGCDDHCLCPALTDLGERIIHRNFPNMATEGETETDAWERGFVGLLSYLLGLKREALADHIRREERKRTARARLIASVTGVLALAAIAGAVISIIKTHEAQRAEAKATKAAEAEVLAKKEATAKNIEASVKAHFRARQAFDGGQPRVGMAYLAEAIGYDPANREVQLDARLRLLSQGCLVPIPILGPLKHDNYVRSAEFAPGDQRIITAGWDRITRIWDVSSGKPVGPNIQHDGTVWSASFSPDGSRMVTTSENRAFLWDVTPQLVQRRIFQHEDTVNSARFSPDGTLVVTASSDDTAQLWNIAEGKLVGVPFAHESNVWSASFSPDGTRLITASQDKTARIWDVASGKPIAPPLAHDDQVLAASFSPDGTRVVTASQDKTARIWDAATGNLSGEPIPHESIVNAAAFSPEGSRIVTACADGTARIWDVASHQPLTEPFRHDQGVSSAEFSSDGSRVLTGGLDRAVYVWDASSGTPSGEHLPHQGTVFHAAFSPDGKYLATGAGHDAFLWDLASGKSVASFFGHDNEIHHVAFSPDGSRLGTASTDHTAQIWDLSSQKQIGQPFQHEGNVDCISFSPDGTRVITASDDTARVWDVLSGATVGKPFSHQKIRFAAFCKDGSRVVTAGYNGSAGIWEAASGKLLVRTDDHHDGLHSFHPSAHKTRNIDITRFDQILVWESYDGVIGQPDKTVWLIPTSLSSDGGQVVWQEANVARIHDAAKGIALGGPFAHEESDVRSTTFSPDGTRIATTGADGSARIWHLPSGHVEPALLARLLVAVSRTEISTSGDVRHLPVETSITLRSSLLAEAGRKDDTGSRLIRWLFSPPISRPLSPEAPLTTENSLLREISWCSKNPSAFSVAHAIRRINGLHPAHPLVPFALASIENDDTRRTFLIDHGIKRLPAKNPEILSFASTFLWDRPHVESALQSIGRILESTPRNSVALQLQIRCLGKLGRYPEQLDVYSRLLTLDEATDDDFIRGGFLASRQRKPDLVRQWFAKALERSPGNIEIHRMHGWALVNVADNAGAFSAFTQARGLLPANAKPSYDLLAGLVISSWLTDRHDEAVTHYVSLIEIGRSDQKPEDWALAATITAKDWPKTESHPLEAARQETLRRHPNLAPKE